MQLDPQQDGEWILVLANILLRIGLSILRMIAFNGIAQATTDQAAGASETC
jgi:hypothetical protein